MLKSIALLILAFLLFHLSALAQIRGVVTDKQTGKPVAYANIWVEDEILGTTSSEDGVFSLADASAVGKVLVVSCLGYERDRFPITSGSMAVTLRPVAVQLQEVTVTPSAQRQKMTVGKLGHTKHSHWYGNGGMPYIVAEFVPYEPSYEATPFLDKISFILWSKVANAKFQIRLLEVGENGQPGKDLLSAPLIGIAYKGSKVNMSLDVSQYNLKIPESGFFVAFEWFVIPENAFEYTYTKKGSKQKLKHTSYEPSILAQKEVKEGQKGWLYRKGAWQNSDFKAQNGEVLSSRAPQFQLTFSD